jgi:hypothetical protein
VVLLVLVLWTAFLREHRDARFIARVLDMLQGNGEVEGEITPEELATLAEDARQQHLPPARLNRLVMQAKTAYLDAKRQKFLGAASSTNALTSEELVELCRVAKRLEMVAEVKACSPPLEDLVIHLHQGEFTAARKLLQSLPDTPTKVRTLTTVNVPLRVEVRLQYQKHADAPSPLHSLDAPELADLTLTHRDNYRLFVSVSQAYTYVYIFQKDRFGQMVRLFPDPVWSRAENPMRNSVTYQIPPGEREWWFLDVLPPDQDTAIQETLYVIASPWPAADIERLYDELDRATSQAERRTLLPQLLNRLRLRADAALPAVYHQAFSFRHEG